MGWRWTEEEIERRVAFESDTLVSGKEKEENYMEEENNTKKRKVEK